LGERSLRQVNGVGVFAGWAIIRNGDNNRLIVLLVYDLNFLAAERGFLARVTVTCLVCEITLKTEKINVLRIRLTNGS
jgi:hypothetical protein